MRDRILHYMSQGISASQTASIVGCSAAYISQLGKDEAFTKELALARGEVATKPADEDGALTLKYMALEHKLLDSMGSQMAFAELPALTRALEVISTRQEKRAQRLAAPKQEPGAVVMVNITLPSHAVPEYQVNSRREVVSIGNRTVAPMSSAGVANLFQQRSAQKTEALAIEVVRQAETEF